MKKLLIVLLLLTVLLTACMPRFTEGKVIAKVYEEPRTNLIMIPISMPCGKSTCITVFPYWVFDDADYKLIMQNGEQKATWYVTPAFYALAQVGDHLTYNDHVIELNDPDIKTRADD